MLKKTHASKVGGVSLEGIIWLSLLLQPNIHSSAIFLSSSRREEAAVLASSGIGNGERKARVPGTECGERLGRVVRDSRNGLAGIRTEGQTNK